MREIHQAIIEYGELIEKIWSKVHANTLQLEKVKEDVKECAQVLKMTDYDKAVRFLKETLGGRPDRWRGGIEDGRCYRNQESRSQ